MQKALNLLGLAYRAGKCTLGEELITRDIQKKKAKLVWIAEDTGYQTKKKLIDKCSFYNIPYYLAADRDTLSQAIGKEGRVAIAVLDQGFAKKLQSLLDESIRG
ncbi:50S ribosomal protein L7ae [Thalassobacillus devorans]|uniref:50S ribosomal protein L7ae n=1 Tax=Thalassobacillus devorans TaxID=279813 RepID=A0ABQ1P379_9BACI|nr:YlxQ family RNA-binding protein [Thalassobacillus devorans]NIK27950.1 ribosomal protein L7Ae-like RNA K-turn-binding protein [Thalassobacillus devorans]GGC90100.1 50S ribosomal protein L7ae [Thalassobacillus devorans]